MAGALPENSEDMTDFDCLANNPYADFGTDMVKFLCELYNIGWHPPGFPNYRISEISPFNPIMARATRILVRGRDEYYVQVYNGVLDAGANYGDNELTRFINNSRLSVSQLIRERRTIGDMFKELVFIARLSLVFYQRGTRSAPSYAAAVVADGVSQLDANQRESIYTSFTHFAHSVPGDEA